MKLISLFPDIQTALSVIAACVYLWHHDYARVGYWLCAAGITAIVTHGFK